MKYLIYLILVLLVVLLFSLINGINDTDKNGDSYDLKFAANWLTDLSAAKALADKEGKPILINFTGSNWCAGCIRLDEEIFSKPAFIDYANEHLILMKIDFPLGVKQDDSLVAQNNFLYDLYEIEGLPTVILMDSQGEIFRDTGYGKDKPENYVNSLKELLSIQIH